MAVSAADGPDFGTDAYQDGKTRHDFERKVALRAFSVKDGQLDAVAGQTQSAQLVELCRDATHGDYRRPTLPT